MKVVNNKTRGKEQAFQIDGTSFIKMVYPISQRKIHINKFIFNAYVFMTIANFA